MAAPSKVAIGWKNLCAESGVTFTPSSEHASHDADGLSYPNPTSFWRATSLPTSGAYVDMDFGGVSAPFTGRAEVGMAAVLYATASAHRNFLFNGGNLTSWVSQSTGTASLGVGDAAAFSPPAFAAKLTPRIVTCDTGTGEFGLGQTFTKPVSAEQHEYRFSMWVAERLNNPNIRLRCEGASSSDYVYADFDLTSGAINGSVQSGGSVSGVSASVLESDGTWHRCEIVFTCDTSASVLAKFNILDSSFAVSFTTSGESIYWTDAYLVREDTVGSGVSSPSSSFNVDDADGTACSLFRVVTSTVSNFSSIAYDSESLMLPVEESLRMWKSDNGWLHAVHLPAVYAGKRYVRVYVYDPTNDASQLDVSNIYIGPVWRPTHSLQNKYRWTVDNFGRRILDASFSAIPQTEYESEALAMAQRCGVGELDQTAAGGQDYGENRLPVVIAVDPANPTQAGIMYAWILSFTAQHVEAEKDASGAYVGERYNVSVRFREVLP